MYGMSPISSTAQSSDWQHRVVDFIVFSVNPFHYVSYSYCVSYKCMLFETNVLLATCTVHAFILTICRKHPCTEHWHFCLVRIFSVTVVADRCVLLVSSMFVWYVWNKIHLFIWKLCFTITRVVETSRTIVYIWVKKKHSNDENKTKSIRRLWYHCDIGLIVRKNIRQRAVNNISFRVNFSAWEKFPM